MMGHVKTTATDCAFSHAELLLNIVYVFW